MAKKTWKVQLEDGEHTVELEHGYWSGKRVISVDGQVIEQVKRKVNDVGSQHPFLLNGHQCVVVIRSNGITYSYDLLLDGRSLKTGREVAMPQLSLLAVPSVTARAGEVATIALTTPSQTQVTAGTYGLMLREIRSWGITLLFLGVLHLIGSGTLNAPWGILLIVVGLASFVFRDAAMFVVYGTTLAWAMISNLTSGQAMWLVFALLQAYLAFRVFQQFFRFRKAQVDLAGLPVDGGLPPAQPEGPAAQFFPWLGGSLGALAMAGTAAVVLGFFYAVAIAKARQLPGYFVPLIDASVNVAVLGLAVSLASLFSRFRYQFVAVLGLVTSALVLALSLALILAF